MPLPTDLIFDPGMFPSLPPPGGKISHAELMGRQQLPQQQRTITPAARGPPPPPRGPSASLDGHGPYSSQSSSHAGAGGRPPLRPGMGLRRVSSFSGSASGNRAGVGAVYNDLPAQALPARGTGRRGSIIGPAAPALVLTRRSSSQDETTPTELSMSSSSNLSTPRPRPRLQHQRTASDSTVSTITRPLPSLPKNNTQAGKQDQSLADGSVRLGRPDQALEIGRLIGTLHALTPPSRVRVTPAAQTVKLHPSFILTPFAVCLEVLVAERSILHSSSSSPLSSSAAVDAAVPAPAPAPAAAPTTDLPTLQDGSTFRLTTGEGEIDWTVLRTYLNQLGNILDQLLPYINTSQDQFALEDLIRSIRMFVGKIKKVFSEVVQGYGDQYGFMKGLWDDKSMKACAGEIARWCDLFDV